MILYSAVSRGTPEKDMTINAMPLIPGQDTEQGRTDMRKLSLREAAKLAGRGKTTIHAAIYDGRLTAERNKSGGYEIDPAELNRVFPLKVDPDTGQFIDQRTPKDSQDSDKAERPSLSLALSRTATRTGRAGGALATAEQELAEALREIERLKTEVERETRHARELAEKEIGHLRETLEVERAAKTELAAAHAAHLADLRRELDQMRALMPPPAPLPTAPASALDPAPSLTSPRSRWRFWRRG